MIGEGPVLVGTSERLDHGGKEARSSGSAAAGGQQLSSQLGLLQ